MGRVERKQQETASKKSRKHSRKERFEEKIQVRESSPSDNAAADSAVKDGDRVKKENIIDKFKNWFMGLSKKKRIAFVTAVVLVVLLLTAGIVGYCLFSSIFADIHKATPEDYDLSLTAVDGYYNILLLGVDSRDMDNLEGTRSDAIMIVSINEETNDVKILSVYRDTFLKMGDTSTYDKITHACAYGGPEMTMRSLNQAMDLNISNYVVVNFKAVADLVDAVGGIEVNVEDYEIQQLNKYTIETANNIGREEYSLVESAGLQTLEGVQAVSYGRIRKGVGDDFKRTERMRTVISLVMDKMKEMSFKDIKKIIKMMTPQVQTNLSKTNILALGIRLPQYNIIGTDGWPYHVSTGYVGGVSYVFPSDLLQNVMELHQKFFKQDDYQPSSQVYEISSTIHQKIEAERNAGAIENEESKDIDTSQENKPPVDVDNPASGDNTGGGETGEGEGGETGEGGSGETGEGGSGETGEGGGAEAGGGGSGETGGGGSGEDNGGSAQQPGA
ncbi:MAG: LCP family protein [Candidatus Fimisoma sp.]